MPRPRVPTPHPQALLASFPRQIAVFTGHRRSGYRLAVEGRPQYGHIHTDSHVCGTNNPATWPRWVAFTELIRGEGGQQYLRHVAAINNIQAPSHPHTLTPSHPHTLTPSHPTGRGCGLWSWQQA